MKTDEKRRVVACVDNRVGYEALRILLSNEGTELCAVIVHPEKTISWGTEIRALCEKHDVPVFDVEEARLEFDELVGHLEPDFLLSIYYDYILDDRFLSLPKIDAINLHPGYLPYNKGFYYYVWSVLDGTPAGVSLHRMVAEVDKGDVIAQARVLVTPEDTGETLYRKHEDEAIRLFRSTWPAIVHEEYKLYPQAHPGTHHKLREMRALLNLDPHATTTARELIDTLRVCTFPGRAGCTIALDGRTYQINLSLREVRDTAASLPGKRPAKSSDAAERSTSTNLTVSPSAAVSRNMAGANS
ncbi:hypothetical protein LZC95_17230 [Pendulispora brunnea]|uniref:Formyl transferase N-terminal domain-containing protein n=1 Tax=Pendulispora brunnea TaxID=2905690 RepID=A0ABZ2KIQ1_9BACT